jgi:hypothetical protein
LVVTCQERNWDLLGELLLCWDCMGFEPSSLTTAAWASFLDAFQADGAVLPRPLKVNDGESEPGGTVDTHVDKASDFDFVYHTTLVAALAGLVRLQRSGWADLISFGNLTGAI